MPHVLATHIMSCVCLNSSLLLSQHNFLLPVQGKSRYLFSAQVHVVKLPAAMYSVQTMIPTYTCTCTLQVV